MKKEKIPVYIIMTAFLVVFVYGLMLGAKILDKHLMTDQQKRHHEKYGFNYSMTDSTDSPCNNLFETVLSARFRPMCSLAFRS